MLFTVMLNQLIIMALLIAVGLFLSKTGMLSIQGTRDLGAILLKTVIPCVIIKSYMTEFSQERIMQLFSSAGLALAGFLLAMAVSYLVYGKRYKIENFASSFCNAGFIGIPLVQAVIGAEGVFYVAASIALLNLFQWTYGVYIMTGKKEAVSIKVIIKNPVVIAIFIGITLFVTQVPVPSILRDVLSYIANLNTPIAMILLGTYMAKVSPRELFFDKHVYGCVFMRLLVIPFLILLVFSLLPDENEAVTMAVFLAAATPVGANICIFAQQYDCDYKFSVITVCLSTVLSVITIPAMCSIAQLML